MMEIPYASLPADMIDTITIDLDGMAVGTVVMVKNIPELMSDAIELRVDPEEIVLRISDKNISGFSGEYRWIRRNIENRNRSSKQRHTFRKL